MKSFIVHLLPLFLLLNCGVGPGGSNAGLRNPGSPPIEDGDGKGKGKDDDPKNGKDPKEIAGQELYGQHCAGCHGVLERSSKRNKSESQISSAIDTIANMKSLATLSADDIEKIAAALRDDDGGGNPPPPGPQPGPQPPGQTGPQLYATHCGACHGHLATSAKRNRTSNAISDAIQNVANMSHLSTLSAENIASIATALTDDDGGNPPPPGGHTGADLYAIHCAGCHGPIATSTKKGKTQAQINAAIQSVTEMNANSLHDLTSVQIGLIATALANQTTDDSLIEGSLGTRSLFAAKLGTIFGSGGTIDTVLRNNVTQQAPVFGGSCQKFDDAGCQADDTATAAADMTGRSTTLRSGYHRKTCLELLSISGTAATALSRKGLTVQSPIDAANLNKMADLFFAGRVLDANSIAKILNLVAAGGAANADASEKWSLVLLAFCQSSAFELL